MAGDRGAEVLDASIALDGGHDESAGESTEVATNVRAAHWRGLNGVNGQSAHPRSVAVAMPPTKPSTVLPGLTFGAIGRRPHSFPR